MGYSQIVDSITTKELKEITVTGYKDEDEKVSPINITSVLIDSVTTSTNFTVCDQLKKVEGVSILSTGNGIAKPVIRGLYGNRVLVLLNGLRFDNQQWQDEHGIGITSFGLSKIELIKGPLGILYGAEAMGGVVNLIEEQKPAANSSETDYGLTFNTNTMGGQFQIGHKAAYKNKWWRIRAGIDNNADYSDGKNNRVLNTRFKGYYLKTTWGFDKNKWSSTNNFSSSFNQFGFVFNDIYNFVYPDKRWSRSLSENPCHLVLLNIFSSENKFSFNGHSKLFVNAGLQSNQRMENEGGGAISLNMLLLTAQALLKLEHQINEHQKIIVANLNSLEDNTNFGARKIVPDASMHENNLSVNYEIEFNDKWIFENGIGYGLKSIKTFFTASVNGPEKEIPVFNKQSPYYNFLSGISFFPNDNFNFKLNFASGVRVANLAELSSDGLHEGIFTYEIGNPNLKNEQLYSLNLVTKWKSKFVELWISPFYNHFSNFIYLAKTNEEWYGFPVYRYMQQGAEQFGGEAGINLEACKNLQFKTSYSGMNNKTADGNYISYTPSQKIEPSISYTLNRKKEEPYIFRLSVEHYFKQNHLAPLELGTPAYDIVNLSVSTNLKLKSKLLLLSISGNNLLNTYYYDHLSRFKNYGIYNMGRNICISARIYLN